MQFATDVDHSYTWYQTPRLETIKTVEEEYEEYEEDDEQFLGIVKSDVMIINSTGAPWTVITTSLNERIQDRYGK